MMRKLFNLFSVVMVIALMLPMTALAQPAASVPVAEAPAAPSPQLNTYIVQLVDLPVASYDGSIAGLDATSPATTGADKLDVQSPSTQAYVAYLESKHDAFLANAKQALSREIEVSFQYLYALNGMAVTISAQEAKLLATLPGVEAVSLDTIR